MRVSPQAPSQNSSIKQLLRLKPQMSHSLTCGDGNSSIRVRVLCTCYESDGVALQYPDGQCVPTQYIECIQVYNSEK